MELTKIDTVAKDKFEQYFVIYRKYNERGLEVGALTYDNVISMLGAAAYLRTCEDVIEVETAVRITQAEALNREAKS